MSDYGIRVTRRYNGPRKRTDWHRDGSGAIHEYATRAEAVAAVREIDGTVYHLSHNESGRPSLRIVRLPEDAR